MEGKEKEEKSIYVVSFQMKVEKWQSDILDKRFATLTTIYKDLQRKILL